MAAGAIDAHVHVWAAGLPGYRPARFTAEEFLTLCRPHGVGRAVLVQPGGYSADHRYMLDAIRAHPGVFAGVGRIEAGRPRPEAAMMTLASRGVRGFRIVPGASPECALNSPGIRAMCRRGAEHGYPMCLLIDPAALAAVDAMCGRFPDTPVVIDHLARIGADAGVAEADIRALCRLARHGRVAVKLSAFYALGSKQPPYIDLLPLIRRVFEYYGPHRLMWGSDAPFQTQGSHTYAASISLVREGLAFLSGADRNCLLSTTAEALFFPG